MKFFEKPKTQSTGITKSDFYSGLRLMSQAFATTFPPFSGYQLATLMMQKNTMPSSPALKK